MRGEFLGLFLKEHNMSGKWVEYEADSSGLNKFCGVVKKLTG
jgi:hypothetical protein